jgi:hypothetical protein
MTAYDEAIRDAAAKRARRTEAFKAWREANREKWRAYKKEWMRAKRASDLEYRARERIQQSGYAAMKRKVETQEQREKKAVYMRAWRDAHPEYNKELRRAKLASDQDYLERERKQRRESYAKKLERAFARSE